MNNFKILTSNHHSAPHPHARFPRISKNNVLFPGILNAEKGIWAIRIRSQRVPFNMVQWGLILPIIIELRQSSGCCNKFQHE